MADFEERAPAVIADPLERWLKAALGDPGRAGVFLDFDGTLSDIVATPDEATAVPGAVEALASLAERLGRVAVVSGRPVAYLAEHLAGRGGTELIGLYGMQAESGTGRGVAGRGAACRYRTVSGPELERWREAVETAAAGAEDAGFASLSVERKSLSVALHYRSNPAAAPAVKDLAAALARRSGLSVHQGKMSVELAPALGIDKGTVVTEGSSGLQAVMFAGDDVGDLPAFRAVDRLAAQGVATLKVTLGGDELPVEVMRAADVVLDGPAALVELLRRMSALAGATRPSEVSDSLGGPRPGPGSARST